MLRYLKKDRWSPYAVGVMIAILSAGSFFFLGKMLGVSTAFVRMAAFFWYVVDAAHLLNNAYYMNYLRGGGWLNWHLMLVIGLFIGSLTASGMSSGRRSVCHVPPIWRERFGDNRFRRYSGAFIGGVILLFGARLAGGCTSGNGISGGMQQLVTGWSFMLGMFALGVPAAFLIYRGGR